MTNTQKPAVTREFVINPYLAVRLEGCETVIYVGGRRFQQCKALVFDLPRREMQDPTTPTSIDEVTALYRQPPLPSRSTKIPPEVEFWGHCSNLQAWADNDYDTRLLHSNLAFPLLKALVDAGDSNATVALKRDIVARFSAGYMPVVKFLVEGQYYRYLTAADLDRLPLNILVVLYGTSVYDLHPAAFERLRPFLPTITLGDKKFVIKLGQLDACKQQMTNVDLEELQKYKDQIKNLNLSYNSLRDFPDALGHIVSLEGLDLSYNQLRTLPDALGNLASLKNLNLEANQLRALPDALGNLASLEYLDLSHNQLRTLPNSLGNLSSLKGLDLSYNQLRTLPDALGKLASLKNLNLEANRLRFLPDTLGNLASLKILKLMSNKLRDLPAAPGNFISLVYLDLSHNQLLPLPDALGNLASLERLDLSHNHLSTLPNSLGNLSSLKGLDLSHNQLQTLPDALGALTTLRELKLNNNQIRTLPDALGALTTLGRLDLSYNPLQLLPEWIVNLELERVILFGNEGMVLSKAVADWMEELHIKRRREYLESQP